MWKRNRWALTQRRMGSNFSALDFSPKLRHGSVEAASGCAFEEQLFYALLVDSERLGFIVARRVRILRFGSPKSGDFDYRRGHEG